MKKDFQEPDILNYVVSTFEAANWEILDILEMLPAVRPLPPEVREEHQHCYRPTLRGVYFAWREIVIRSVRGDGTRLSVLFLEHDGRGHAWTMPATYALEATKDTDRFGLVQNIVNCPDFAMVREKIDAFAREVDKFRTTDLEPYNGCFRE
jgi:hypothetical protein